VKEEGGGSRKEEKGKSKFNVQLHDTPTTEKNEVKPSIVVHTATIIYIRPEIVGKKPRLSVATTPLSFFLFPSSCPNLSSHQTCIEP